MNFLSVCSGIEAKACSRCATVKPLTEFHKQPNARLGRTAACKPCAIAAQRASREKHGRVPHRRSWNLSTRYGMTEADEQQMLQQQGGACAICAQQLIKHRIDHDHATGKVRGLLCHGCNVALGHVEKPGFLAAALAYLGAHK